MKTLFKNLHDFLDIDNPLLIVTVLSIIVLNRLALTFFNAGHHVVAPDNYYYAGVTVGRDWISGTTQQSYRLLRGLPMQLATGYGYTFTILTAWIIVLFNSIGLCSMSNQIACQFLLYKLLVTISIAGLIVLTCLLIQNRMRRAIALIFLIAFFLGVPGGRGIETGNLDIILSGLYGIMLCLQKRSLIDMKYKRYPILLGVLSGAFLQTKLFALPIVILFLLESTQPILFFLSFLMTISIIGVIPVLYGIPFAPFQTIQAAQKVLVPMTADLYTKYTYGNNNTRAMVGSIVFATPVFYKNVFVREFLIFFSGGLLFLIILITPFTSFASWFINRMKYVSLRDRLNYSLFIVINCYTVAAIILWTSMSYDYRFFYLIPLLYILLNMAKRTQERQLIGIALLAFIIRSMFVLHTKMFHVFLIIFFYCFLSASLSIWLSYANSKRRL